MVDIPSIQPSSEFPSESMQTKDFSQKLTEQLKTVIGQVEKLTYSSYNNSDTLKDFKNSILALDDLSKFGVNLS